MSKFKIGDRVTPINIDNYTQYSEKVMNQMLGKMLIVTGTSIDSDWREVIHAGIPGELDLHWYPEDLFLLSEPQINHSTNLQEHIGKKRKKRKKPLKCGQLVEYKGRIWIILSEADVFGEYEIASIADGSSLIDSAPESKLTLVGSIRKKIKHLEAALETKNG